MVEAFDRIVIGVADFEEALLQYGMLLGLPRGRSAGAGTSSAWFGLANTVIELRRQEVAQPRVAAIVFRDPSADADDRALPNSLDLELYGCSGAASDDFRRRSASSCSTELQVDHLVLRTDNADACIELFGRELGIRLALDRRVPEWGGRMLFFRVGKLTLEVIESDRDSGVETGFWGVAYQCPEIEQAAAAMRARGVALTEVRQGRKPGTRVATVKSHCLGIPTLLIEPAT